MRIILSFIVALGLIGATMAAEYDIMGRTGNMKVVFVGEDIQDKESLSKIGYSVCRGMRFCVIWFFNDRLKASAGVRRMVSGDFWNPIPGLIGIYSRNMKVDEIICYDLNAKDC